MTTYNTGNPIGSTDARDRADNSENLDFAVNSLSPTFVDRFGRNRDTLEGVYQKSAYYRAGTFDAGYTLTNNRQTLAYGNVEYSWSGAFPKAVAAGSTPATSGGVGAGAWVDRTQSTLRSEISAIDGDSKIGYATYQQIRSYAGDLKSIRCGGRSSLYSGDGAHGKFYRDDVDVTTEDDDCTVLVDILGRRWKRKGVKNSVDVAWAGAKIGDSSFDNSEAFKNAMKSVYRLSKTTLDVWPNTKRCALVGIGGEYYFSSGFITPDFSAPNFVNYDILMPDAVFRPTLTYDLRYPLIHAKACFEYTWEFGVFGFQSATNANDTMYVIFNDSSREQNYGGKCTYKIKAGDTEYVIRHELESVVANFDECMTNKNIKRFLRVWRCDQAHMDKCFFNWEQNGRDTYDSFIQWGLDDGTTTEPTYPGNGTYNAGRLSVTNSVFIPNGTGVTRVHTGWIENISGVVDISEACHFGPESNNRPSIVLNRSIGATFSSQSDLTESGVYIDGASCASSWDLVYCISDYPNVISIKNVRWNVLDYSNGQKLTYPIGGDAAALNAKSSKYSPANSSLFHFHIDLGTPAWRGINDIDPSLSFAHRVTTRAEIPFSLAPWVSLPTTTLVYDIQNRDGLMPAVPNAGTYEVVNTYSINSTSELKLITATSIHNVSLVKNGENMELVVTPLVVPPSSVIGATPSLIAVFVNPSNAEVSTALKSSIDSGDAYFIRLKYASNSLSNTFVGEDIRIKRVS